METTHQSAETPDRGEQYSHGHSPEVARWFGKRTAQHDAAFFIPHLRPGMTLLDCGCGVGTITVGLAEIVSPGEVVGIDSGEASLEHAKALAEKESVSNIRFEIGNVNELPYADKSFDAVFSHMVIEHLKEPNKALQEMRRVLKPGGLIGIRDSDFGSQILAPISSRVDQLMDIYCRYWQHNGGDPYTGRKVKSLLQDAGFSEVEFSASTLVYATPEEFSLFSTAALQIARQPDFADVSVSQGWADSEDLQQMIEAFEKLAKQPDAFRAIIYCAAVGWKDS